ncbi:MAG: hypothetical protein MZV49_08800 [Rhodopseudomonas palustris]|nr:hypothetical protein [Rhodopseudomonas palustris]
MRDLLRLRPAAPSRAHRLRVASCPCSASRSASPRSILLTSIGEGMRRFVLAEFTAVRHQHRRRHARARPSTIGHARRRLRHRRGR